jgi:glycosyltransferase involved in cell wall biosynthesis
MAKGSQQRNDHLEITNIGKLVWKKQFLYALEAMNLLKGGLKFNYQIIGGEDPTEIRFHIEDLELKNQVKLVHHLLKDQVLGLILERDFLLFLILQKGFAFCTAHICQGFVLRSGLTRHNTAFKTL